MIRSTYRGIQRVQKPRTAIHDKFPHYLASFSKSFAEVLGRIPVYSYSAIFASLMWDSSDIRRAISFSALEMCRRMVY